MAVVEHQGFAEPVEAEFRSVVTRAATKRVPACQARYIYDETAAARSKACQRKRRAPRALAERVSESARHFEATHPEIASALGRVIDALAALGI